MVISERVFELIKDREMTQKEFALATGMAESTISDWKRCSRKILSRYS